MSDCDLVEEEDTAIVRERSLAPDQEDGLGQAVAGQPAEDPVPHHLEHHQPGHQHPVLQPSLVILWFLAEDGLDGHVAWVDEADQIDEDLAAIAGNETDQQEKDQPSQLSYCIEIFQKIKTFDEIVLWRIGSYLRIIYYLLHKTKIILEILF